MRTDACTVGLLLQRRSRRSRLDIWRAQSAWHLAGSRRSRLVVGLAQSVCIFIFMHVLILIRIFESIFLSTFAYTRTIFASISIIIMLAVIVAIVSTSMSIITSIFIVVCILMHAQSVCCWSGAVGLALTRCSRHNRFCISAVHHLRRHLMFQSYSR